MENLKNIPQEWYHKTCAYLASIVATFSVIGDFLKQFWKGISMGLGFLLIILLGAYTFLTWASHNPNFHYKTAYLPKDDAVVKLTDIQTKSLNQLISKGVVISASDLYSDTIAFYSLLITHLVGILGLGAFIGFVYLKSNAREYAEHEAEKAVENYFAKASTQATIKDKVAPAFDLEIGEMKESLDALADKVEFLMASAPSRTLENIISTPSAPPTPSEPGPKSNPKNGDSQKAS